LRELVKDRDEIKDCKDFTITKAYGKKEFSSVEIDCNGTPLHVQMFFTMAKLLDSNEEQTERVVPGGFQKLDDKEVEYFLNLSCQVLKREGCEVDESSFLQQVVNGKNLYCKAKCDEGDDQHMNFHVPRPSPGQKLTPMLIAISDTLRPEIQAILDKKSVENLHPPSNPINMGLVEHDSLETDKEATLRELVKDRDEIKDCKDFTITKAYGKKEFSSVEIDCNGTPLHVQMFFTMAKLLDSNEEQTERVVPGGFQKLDDKEVEYFLNLSCQVLKREGCEVDESSFLQQVVNGKNLYCKAKCDEGDDQHMNFHVPRPSPGQKLTPMLIAISDTLRPEIQAILDKKSVEKLQEVFTNSTPNTWTFLKNHCKFSGTKDDVKVTGGNYIELETGTQYCIDVKTDQFGDDDKEACIAIYQYTEPDTDPFLVAHPFEKMDHCKGFLHKIAEMWSDIARQKAAMASGN